MIRNKFKTEKLTSILNILFWLLNFIFVEISVNMFLKIISAGKSEWFYEAAEIEMQYDALFLSKSEMIINTIVVIVVMIVFFAIVTIVLFRNFQLKNMLAQMGIYRVLGYDKKGIFKLCMIEPMIDMCIAFPISIILSISIWKILYMNRTVYLMMQLVNDNIWMDILAYILCAGIMILVNIVHTKIYMEKCLKKGIRYMLAEGEV